MEPKMPIIECEIVKAGAGITPTWRFWCEHCRPTITTGPLPGIERPTATTRHHPIWPAATSLPGRPSSS
jgi:hypothetical protein